MGAFFAWSRLTDLASDGLTFGEWVLGLLGGIAVGAGTGLVGLYGTRWVDRHRFGGDDDE